MLDWSKLQIIPEEVSSTKTDSMADKALTDAVSCFWEDLGVRLAEVQERSQPFYSGKVGEKSWQSDLTFSGDYIGMIFRSKGLIDTKFYLNKIGVIINETKSVDVSLYKGSSDTNDTSLVESFTVPCTANELSELSVTDKVYDLVEDGCPVWYYLIYNPTTEKPKDTKIHCGCGGRKAQELNSIRRFTDVSGIQGDDLTKLKDWNRSDSGNGLVLDVDLKCDEDNLICRNYSDDSNFERVVKMAIQNKAASLFIQQVLDDSDVSRLALVNRETLYGKRNHFEKEYGDRIEYLAIEGVNTDLNDCYHNRPSMKTIPMA